MSLSAATRSSLFDLSVSPVSSVTFLLLGSLSQWNSGALSEMQPLQSDRGRVVYLNFCVTDIPHHLRSISYVSQKF
jgi:hypothetical protein